MRNHSFRTFQTFFDGPDGGSGGGPAAVAPPPPSGAGAPPAPPAAPTPASVTPPAPPAGTPPAAPTRYEYDEDRSSWLPPDRAEQMRNDAAREAQAKADRFRAMAEAAAGIQFPAEPTRLDPRVQEARASLERIMPGINQFYEVMPYLMQMAQQMQGAKIDPRQLSALPDVFSSVDVQWKQHGANQLKPIYDAIAQDYGVDSLNPRQRDNVTRDFIDWLEADRTGARAERYTQGDPNLRGEYLSDYRGAFIHPLQRTGAPGAGAPPPRAAGLPPAPRSGGGAPPVGAPPAAPTDLDAAADASWVSFRAAQGR